MAIANEQQLAAEKLLEDESLISQLKDSEAKALIDWALSELEPDPRVQGESLAERTTRIRQAMREINELVGSRHSLVADDLEERMTNLLVADLDPKSQVRLEIERDIAQVTAAKDHLESVALVRGLTQIASKTWRARMQAVVPVSADVSVPTGDAAEPSTSVGSAAEAKRSRPIPRPTPVEPKRAGLFGRLFGRK